ncbi:DUF86 domain-containing protein [Nesterenkonia muleiensis]|uniref:HepT-like ribonuclease domain-containing protein n=1 Tax=Nesterenkonia muleiensis TaxID=2282648 RepID=UPI000E764423|nr:HepT-like ribonuclease domain-containing protein [Nesterenkonia muleiensis]
MTSDGRHERKLRDISRQLGICRMIADEGYEAFVSRSPAGLTNRYAAERAIEIIAEATRGLDEDWKAEHSKVPWRRIYDMRNLLSHEYGRVDYDVVWNVLTAKLPEFVQQTGVEPETDPYSEL